MYDVPTYFLLSSFLHGLKPLYRDLQDHSSCRHKDVLIKKERQKHDISNRITNTKELLELSMTSIITKLVHIFV